MTTEMTRGEKVDHELSKFKLLIGLAVCILIFSGLLAVAVKHSNTKAAEPVSITWGSWKFVVVPDPRETAETQEIHHSNSVSPQGYTCDVYANRTSKDRPWRLSYMTAPHQTDVNIDPDAVRKSCREHANEPPFTLR